MAWTAPRTWVTGEIVTAALLNTHVRDNLLQAAPAKVTTAGDIVYANGSNSLTRLALGAGGTGTFLKGGVSAPSWSDSIDGDLKISTSSRHLKMLETDGADAADFWTIEHNSGALVIGFDDDSLGTYTQHANLAQGDWMMHSGQYGQGKGAVVIGTDTHSGPTAVTTTGANILDVTAVVTGAAAYVEGFWMVEIERTSAASVSTIAILPREDGNNLSTVFSYDSSQTALANVIIPGANDIHTLTGMWWRRVTSTDTSDYELFISAGDNSRFQVNRGHMYVRSIQYPT